MKENSEKRSSPSELGFIHQFIPSSTRPDQVTLLLLHGTGKIHVNKLTTCVHCKSCILSILHHGKIRG
jgi:hypothetical protein